MVNLEKLAVQSLVEHNGELIFSKEKFAELIVKECANLCRARKLAPSAFTADDLLEHFGVDE